MRPVPQVGRWLPLALLFALGDVSHCEQPLAEGLRLELVSIAKGNRQSSFGGDRQRFQQTEVFQAAQAAGINLDAPGHPFIAFSCRRGRLFYLFYNDVLHVPEGRYLIQRIKRTKIDYSRSGQSTTVVDYQVEAMKSLDGRLKKPDQHFALYSLRPHQEKREIVKEFQVGIGEIEGLAEGDKWPFDRDILFKQIQPYGRQPDAYQQVKLEQSMKWRLSVSFDRHGNYEMRSAALGIEIVWSLPPSARSVASSPSSPANVTSTTAREVASAAVDVVLQEGQGVLGVTVGESRLEDAKRLLGEPVGLDRLASATNYHFPQRITLNLAPDQPVNTIFTRPGFNGRTSKGIRHGDTRDKIHQRYGEPLRATRGTIVYEDVIFWLDRAGRVSKIVIWRRAPRSDR